MAPQNRNEDTLFGLASAIEGPLILTAVYFPGMATSASAITTSRKSSRGGISAEVLVVGAIVDGLAAIGAGPPLCQVSSRGPFLRSEVEAKKESLALATAEMVAGSRLISPVKTSKQVSAP